MFKVNKGQEPKFLLDFKRKNSPKTWEDYNGSNIRKDIKEYVLENEQEKYCPYCEKAIDLDDGHIEHIQPRDLFPKLFQEYNNLIISCNEKNTCGSHKGNKYSNDFINPVIENPKDYFTFNLASGEIIPKCKSEEDVKYKKALYTINLLNLNCYILKEARKNFILLLEMYRENCSDYLQCLLDDGHNFPSLIEYYIEE